MKRKLLSMVLALALVVGVMPMTAQAEEAAQTLTITIEDNQVIRLKQDSGNYQYSIDSDDNWNDYTGSITINGGEGTGKILFVSDGTYEVKLDGVKLYSITTEYANGRRVNLNLELANTNVVNNTKTDTDGTDGCGIQVQGGNLNINGSGSLSASSSKQQGIYVGNDLTINDGTVTATSSMHDGISASSGKVEITGGSVTATSSNDGRGIFASKGKVEITGGSVDASGNLGHGIFASKGEVKITGGSVDASGNGKDDFGSSYKGIDAFSGVIIADTVEYATDDNNMPSEGFVRGTGANVNNEMKKYVKTQEAPPAPSQGGVIKPWVPTTPEEIYAHSLFGAGDYTDMEDNFYRVSELTKEYPVEMERMIQGPLCIAVMKNYETDGYILSRTYNLLPEGADLKKPIYEMDEDVEIILTIPKALQKEGRSYRMSCVTKDGYSFLLEDLDQDANTITFKTDRFYAFALYYKD